MGTYVSAADILALALDGGTPSSAQSDWADKCEAAIEGAIANALGDGAITPSASKTAQLEAAALLDGVALFAMRTAPHGVLSITPDGDIARLGSDQLRACRPILYPISPGIA